MESAPANPPATVTVRELCHISPSAVPSDPTTITTFPLTLFDIYWLRAPPTERLFFYSLPSSSAAADSFYSDVLPSLKLSLAAALSHFYPLAASLTWPSDSPKPCLTYSPSTAGVPLSIAESTADFRRLASGDQIRSSRESHPYVPELPTSDSEAAVIALQITNFPGQGFCIGMSNHHAVLDGKSATLFVRAWAHLSNAPATSSLPEELTPFLDRSIVDDPDGLEQVYLDFWAGLNIPGMDKPGPRSLKLAPSLNGGSSDSVKAAFTLSQERIQTIRERVAMNSGTSNNPNKIRLSSFVLTFAHTLICLVKAKQLGIGSDAGREVVHFGFTADGRGRMNPPLPANFLGNCVIGRHVLVGMQPLLGGGGDGGIGLVVEMISGMIDDVEESGALEKDNFSRFVKNIVASRGFFVGIAGSPRFGVYGADFGWGKPQYVEVTSIDRSSGISMAECRDGSRGIEVGLALTLEEMELFRSAFAA